ncbi:MAG: IS1 family transposase [bacterium]|nr:IS1 family transposase [bacterium]
MTTNSPGWQPPHCPNPDCLFHQQVSPDWRYKRKGYFSRRCAPKRIQRFTCLRCGRNFSTQTFSTSYWQKRPDLMSRLFMTLVGLMSNRQSARAEHVAASTVQRRRRLARPLPAVPHSAAAADRSHPEIVVDGFETLRSQHFPFHHNVADPATAIFSSIPTVRYDAKGV